MNRLDYGTPFTYFFEDRSWLKKLAAASLLTCTLVGAAPVLGWTLAIARRISQGEGPPVGELSDWKSHWRLGGAFAFVNALWLLPLLLAVIVLYLPLIFTEQLEAAVLPVWGGTLCCVLIFLVIYSTIYVFLIPAMMVALAAGESTWKAANPIHLWRLARPRWGDYLVVFLIVGLAMTNVILLLSPLTLFLGLAPMLVYAGLVAAHFAGQLGRMDSN
jgi:hypothetical protein